MGHVRMRGAVTLRCMHQLLFTLYSRTALLPFT